MGPHYFGLCELLKPYSQALNHLGRDAEAKKAETQLAEIQSSLHDLRQQIAADPDCKFPWEK